MKAISKNLVGASGPSLDSRRAAAGAVDLAVVGAGAGVILLAAGGTMTGLLGVVMVGWALFYYYATESNGGQTLGKRLLGLRVERQGGGTPGEREIVTRTLLRVVDGIGFYLVGLVTMIVTGERRQRLGDLAAGTVVVGGNGASKPKVSNVSTMAAAPSVSTSSQSSHALAPTLEAELFAPEPRYHPEMPDEDALDEAALADAGIFEVGESEPQPEPEPADEAEQEDLRAEFAEDDSPRIEIISEAEEEEAFASGAEWDLAGAEAGEPAGDPGDDSGDLPKVSSPALEELAQDVAASAKDRDPDAETAEELPTAEAAEPDAPTEESLTVKPVETVSPMDLVMSSGKDDGDDDPDGDADSSHEPARSRGGAA